MPPSLPDRVDVEELYGDERDRAWDRITREGDRFAKYQKKTDREIPVIRLTAVASD